MEENPAKAPPVPGAGGYRRRLWLLVAVSLAASVLAGRGIEVFVAGQQMATLTAQAGETATLTASVLQAELEKQRALPLVLAQDPDVMAALRAPLPARLEALDRRLQQLAGAARVSVIYLLNAEGTAIASSNWQQPDSFVGTNYGFRPYFRQAVRDGAVEHFALGFVSGQPGLYFGRRIESAGRPLGVLVVKMTFDGLEADWRRLSMPVVVADSRGIVLMTSVADWRFATRTPLTEDDRRAVVASRQFGDAALRPLPVDRRPGEEALLRLPGTDAALPVAEIAVPVGSTDWSLLVFASTAEATGLGRLTGALGALAVLVVMLGAGSLALWRAEQRRRRAADEAATRAELEARVAERTGELRAANERLRAEMDARRRAATARQQLQDELLQANRLATLGQIAAGVAHEINQPVAAIRTFADNAMGHLDRGDAAAARRSVASVAKLTERIGAITGELRTFGRKAPVQIVPVSLAEVLDGALLLLGHRLRTQHVEVKTAEIAPGLRVMADQLRLEQVFVNLMQNALDAMAGQGNGTIEIRVAESAGQVTVTIRDNGPGLPPAILEAVFTPFSTTKPKGLGLGLVIAHDIVAEFGGRLSAGNDKAGGAVMTMILSRGVAAAPGGLAAAG
ncbi:ATP-binding protein [Pseudoxanthobacter sp.]|uniref:sensor histidine kinase n=1 Tax=Pseudoxanthobacter sp. TaxID=1925742 RepID=UPI002FE11F5F